MAYVGDFEILHELYLTHHGSVSQAVRTEGGEKIFAVKRLTTIIDDPSEPHWELQTFLDRARAQQGLTGMGARRWAPIHQHGMQDDFAFYATDYHPLTAQKLIDGRVAIKAPVLRDLILGVVQGLTELRTLRSRAHGNLKPGNVLLSGKELQDAIVLLTDPASNGMANKAGEPGDVRAVGELIYQLVLHRASSWPVAPAPDWAALGMPGDEWRLLCNDLLNPDPAARPTLIDLKHRLDSFKRQRKSYFRRVFAVAAGLTLALGAGIAVLSTLDHSARAQFSQTRREWFGHVIEVAADPIRSERWEADPDLRRLLATIPADRLASVADYTGWRLRWNYNDFRDVVDGNRAAQLVMADLPLQWNKAAHLTDLRRRLRERGWIQPADYLGKLVDGVLPIAGNNPALGVERLLAAAPRIDAGLPSADKDWKKFTDNLGPIDASHDLLLSAFSTMLRKDSIDEVRLSDEGFHGLENLHANAILAQKLTDAIRNTWPVNVDRDNFERDITSGIDLKHPGKADVGRWLAAVEFNAIRHDEALAAAAQLRKKLTDTVDLVTRARITPDESGAFEIASRDVHHTVDDFEATPFTLRTLNDGTFARRRDEINLRIDGLRRYYHPEIPEAWVAGVPTMSTDSPCINARWKAWRSELGTSLPVMITDHKVFAARQQASDKLFSLLAGLDQGFPPAPPIPNEAFLNAVRGRREQDIQSLIETIDPADPALDKTKVASVVDHFNQWAANLVGLSRDFPINREILRPSYRPDLHWKNEKPEFWNDPTIVALVKNDVARIARLEAVDRQSRQDLIKTIERSDQAEIALRAWERLGEPAIQPPWPTGAGELAAELKVRQRLTVAFKNLTDPKEGDDASKELAEVAPNHWRRFVESATSEAMLLDAWRYRLAFSVDAKQIALLSPVARYDMYLAFLHKAIDAGDNTAAIQAAAGLTTALEGLKDQPGSAHLSDRIGRLALREAFADQKPGDVFTLTLPGTAKPLEFKRVEPADARPFYLCKTAVSVGQFAAVMDANKAWEQGRQLHWAYEPGKPDPRRGPRSWEWNGSTISPPPLWLTPDEYNDYPPSFRAVKSNRMSLAEAVGGNPSPDVPIQYISAEIALYFAGVLECRLPTSAEWQSAYDLFEKSVPLDKWNLRDQTWEAQRQHVVSGAGSRWPDEGIFSQGVSAAMVGRGAKSLATQDGVLFFQSVGAPSGTLFKSLIGNVAQFTCDASEPFEAWEDKRTAAGIRKFVAGHADAIFAIGGSALSAPELSMVKPLPVARADESYADVGLRLAFTAPSRTLAEKVKWAIGDPPFIWNKSEGVVAGGK